MRKQWLTIVSFIIGLSLILAACDSTGDDTSPATDATAAPQSDSAPTNTPDTGGAAPANTPDTAANVPASVDLGFRPETNGFSFPNYGSETQVTNLTPAEIQRMFGNQVCANQDGGTCTLVPPMQQWMEQVNSAMNGGHCEGFATLSLLMYTGKIDPQQFGGATAAQLQLGGNELLQREIAYWFATQVTLPTRDAFIIGTPAEIVTALKTAYAAGNASSDTYDVHVFKPDMTGGHAVTAYGVEDKGNGLFWIMVYDNNVPGQARHIDVDVNANTWQYEASPNPSVQSYLYTGDANTKTLSIAPNSVRMGQQVCEYCSQATAANSRKPGLAAPAEQFNQVWLEGDAAFLITDAQNHRLGYDKGVFVNEIPSAKIERVVGSALNEEDVPPTFYMPLGMDFTLVIDGDSIKAVEENATDAVVVGPGYYIGVEGIYMDPGQKDLLHFAGNGKSISYKTDYAESPTIIVGIETPAADYELELKGTDIKPGSETIVEFDAAKGVLSLRSTSDQEGKFYIAITRIDDNGEETFESSDEDIVLKANEIIHYNFGAWGGQGKGLQIQLDTNGDGTIDETIDMADQK